MRHAKSDWADAGSDDMTRPLNDRGRKAAPLMAKFMVENKIDPDRVLCSAAVRTRETLENMIDFFSKRPKVTYQDSLYLASPATMLTSIKSVDEDTNSLLVVGHNPGTEMLALALANSGTQTSDGLRRIFHKFPTASIAHFAFVIGHWSEIAERTGRLELFETPKSIKARRNH